MARCAEAISTIHYLHLRCGLPVSEPLSLPCLPLDPIIKERYADLYFQNTPY